MGGGKTKGKIMKKLYIFCLIALCCHQGIAAGVDDFFRKVDNMSGTGVFFKSSEMEMRVGVQYKLSDIVKSDFAAKFPVSASQYSGPARDALIATAPCDITYSVRHAGKTSTYNITTGQDTAGGSVAQGLDAGELEASWIRFDSDTCLRDGKAWLYADGNGWADIIRIRLAPAVGNQIGGLEKSIPLNLVNAAKSACGGINIKELETIKNTMIGSAVVAGVGAAGNIVASGFNIANAVKKPDEVAKPTPEGENEAKDETTKPDAAKPDAKKVQGTVNVVASGVGAATGTASAVMSGVSADKLGKLIERFKECQNAVNKL